MTPHPIATAPSQTSGILERGVDQDFVCSLGALHGGAVVGRRRRVGTGAAADVGQAP